MVELHWVDKLTAPFAPRWTARRMRARISLDVMARYESAGNSRRTSGWKRTSGDANVDQGGDLATLRSDARDLIQNNAYAKSALSTITRHIVGWGISATTPHARAGEVYKQWAESTACDADGRKNIYGIQKIVMNTVVVAGECLVRRRWRRPGDTDSTGKKLPIPLQLQILEPDYLDTLKDAVATLSGGWITQGKEYGPFGRLEAYWLFREHPGSARPSMTSERIPASEILHVFLDDRPGAVRGASWFGPVTLRMKDFDEYLDAALLKQKIAACLAVITSDINGDAPLGTAIAQKAGEPEWDRLEPGGIHNVTAGRSVTVVEPPAISEHAAYAKTVLSEIATGLGVTYEDLTGSYEGLPYSAARMSRLRHWDNVHDWRWNMLIPQFCDPVWSWVMTAAMVGTLEPINEIPTVEWTAPPPAMLDPSAEVLAYMRALRIGAITWPEMVRELGYDPKKQLEEIKKWKTLIDESGLIFDSDPATTTQGGQLQGAAAAKTSTTTSAAEAAFRRSVEDIVRSLRVESLTNGDH